MLSEELPAARCRRWLYEDIKEARFMRFLLEVGRSSYPIYHLIQCLHSHSVSFHSADILG